MSVAGFTNCCSNFCRQSHLSYSGRQEPSLQYVSGCNRRPDPREDVEEALGAAVEAPGADEYKAPEALLASEQLKLSSISIFDTSLLWKAFQQPVKER